MILTTLGTIHKTDDWQVICNDIRCPPMPVSCFKNASKKGYLQAIVVSEQGWCSLQWGKTCGLPSSSDDQYELETDAVDAMVVCLEAAGDRIELLKGKYADNTLLALWVGRRKEGEELHRVNLKMVTLVEQGSPSR